MIGTGLINTEIIRPELSGEIKGKITEEGAEYIRNLFRPRKSVLTLSPTAMLSLKKLPSGATVLFQMGLDQDWSKGYFKITRRDWKRCKVYMMEVDNAEGK